MLLSTILLGLAGMVGFASADDGDVPDLRVVLANHKNLTTYYKLIKKYPDILMQLPAYGGVTIVAPSDKAFKRIPYTSLNHIWDPNNGEITVPYLQYMILQGTVSTEAIVSGPTFIKPTLLVNHNYTNVTNGQNIGVVKQPEDVVVFTTSMGTRCTVIEKDIRFKGGLIQIVDNLLLPPARIRETTEAFKLNSYLGGLYAADLLPDLADRQNVTIFAPRNDAFERIGGNFKNMTAKQVARIMAYHVVPNQVIVSSDLKNGTYLETLTPDGSGNGTESILIQQGGNNLYINSAQLVQADILLANGIMHIISNVLNPDIIDANPNPKIPTQPPVFPVSTVDKLPFTSSIPCTISCPVTATADDNLTIATATPTTSMRSRSSKGAAPAGATAHIAGAALGMMGIGAGMAWL
ncbi:Fc.00g038030.m01.CDS01 [Cosmosporella sp. VM-42]